MKFAKVYYGLFVSLLTLTAAVARADAPSVHGMVLFGDKVTYASHLPMFHAPHDYQLILQLSLGDLPRSMTLAHYDAVKAEGEDFFTLLPEVLDLTQVIDGSKTSFQAAIYVGHFEQGGDLLGPVVVNVVSIVHAAKLDADPAPSDLPHYLLFGGEGEYFAAHLIKGKPSFDAVFEASQPVLKSFCGRGGCPDPVMAPIPDVQLPVTAFLGIPEVGQLVGFDDFGPQAVLKKLLYFEEGELSH